MPPDRQVTLVSHYFWSQDQVTLAHAFTALLRQADSRELTAHQRSALTDAAESCLVRAAQRHLVFRLGPSPAEQSATARLLAYLANQRSPASAQLGFAHLAATDTAGYDRILERIRREAKLPFAELRALEEVIQSVNGLITESVLIVCRPIP